MHAELNTISIVLSYLFSSSMHCVSHVLSLSLLRRTFTSKCGDITGKLMAQINKWGMNASCGSSEKCFYKVRVHCRGSNCM